MAFDSTPLHAYHLLFDSGKGQIRRCLDMRYDLKGDTAGIHVCNPPYRPVLRFLAIFWEYFSNNIVERGFIAQSWK
jgi:hypothetical protein